MSGRPPPSSRWTSQLPQSLSRSAAGLQVGDVAYLRRVLLVGRQLQHAPGGAVEMRAPK